jgi:SAM-dependent methyltransferase
MGWSLDYLKRTYPNIGTIAAIESSEHCLDHLKDTIGAEIIAPDMDSDWHRSQGGRFDLVVMRHVLEHFLDPRASLEKVRAVLAEDGIVYLAVPDMMNPKGSLYDYWFRVVHTFYFSGETLKRFAREAGLDPVTIREEASELWGVFRKSGNGSAPGKPVNVYPQQAAAIRRQKRKEPYFRLRKGVRTLVGRLVPRGIRARLRGRG